MISLHYILKIFNFIWNKAIPFINWWKPFCFCLYHRRHKTYNQNRIAPVYFYFTRQPIYIFQIATFLYIFGIATCTLIPAAPLVTSPVLAKISDDTVDPNPSYSFAYDVQDALTGDSKGQIETRANGIVQGNKKFISRHLLTFFYVIIGQYNLAEPDGTRRIVDYVADPINGFNAIVRKTPQAVAAPIVAASGAQVVAAPAPIIARSAPIVASPAAALFARAAPLVATPAFTSPLVAAPGVNYGIYRT